MSTKTASPVNYLKLHESSISDLPDYSIISTILDSTGIMIASMKLDTTVLYVSRAIESLLQYSMDEITGKKVMDIIHPDDKKMSLSKLAYYTKEFVNVTIKNFLSEKKAPVSESIEYRVKNKKGEWQWLESVGTIVDGKIFTLSRNVTERKQAEISLAESSIYDKLRAKVWKIASDKSFSEDELIQNLLDLIGPAFNVSRACYNQFINDDPYKSDIQTTVEWCDKNVKSTLGAKLPASLIKHFLKEEFSVLTPEKALKIIPKPQRMVLKPIILAISKAQNVESMAMFPHYVEKRIVGIVSFDICRSKKERPVWSDEKVSIIKEIVNIVSSHIVQKKTENALVHANKFNQLRAEVWKLAADKSLSEDALIQKLLDLIGPAIDVSRASYNKFVSKDPYKSDLEVVFEWCADNVKPALGSKQPSVLVRHFLKKEFAHFTIKSAIDSISLPQRLVLAPLIQTMTKAQNLYSVSILPHYIEEKPVGLWAFDICRDKKDKPAWTEEMSSIVKEGVTIVSNHIAFKKAEKELSKHRDKLEDLVIKRTVELVSANKKLKNEMAERKKTEVALRRAEKMEAVGLLAGGVAHDLNNILSGLVTCPDLLLLELPKDSDLREIVDAIKVSGTKAAAVVQDLLLLSKTSFTDTGIVDLNNVVNDYTGSLEFKKLQSSRPGIFFKINLRRGFVHLVGSPLHISKIIMNLVINAAEAIPEKGTISISTRSEHITEEKTGYEVIKPGDYSVLNITDTGKGISKEDIQRIFEPFYTKKVLNRAGTGLGLSIVWRTVKDHKGFVDIKSEEKKGTTFDLYFPLTTKDDEETREITLEPEMYQGKGEKILVVDDIEEQRNIALQILEKLHYNATAISSGEDAIEYLKKNEADLVVLDMIMDPGIDGFETYKRILEFRPDQKAIITSGFSETLRVRKTQKLGAGEYVQKPYSMESLGIALRNELKK